MKNYRARIKKWIEQLGKKGWKIAFNKCVFEESIKINTREGKTRCISGKITCTAKIPASQFSMLNAHIQTRSFCSESDEWNVEIGQYCALKRMVRILRAIVKVS